jgi:hypothetical protein
MSRTVSNLAALVFAVVLTAITFQQALLTPGAARPATTAYILA